MLRYSRVKSTSGKSSYDPNDLQINQDQSLISFFNHCLPREPLSAELHHIDDQHGAHSLSWLSIGSLDIEFRRTIRVPETEKSNILPPELETFPLYNVAEFSRVLPQDMVEKGGLFFPMYQREAMWLKIKSNSKFAIRIYVGGINAITGEPMIPNTTPLLERQHGVEKKQDYIIVPEQEWFDGIATSPGMVKQFVAVPYGSGYSFEYQVAGSEKTGGIQFEVIPAYRVSVRFEGRDIYRTPRELGLAIGSDMIMTNLEIPPSTYGGMRITIKALTGKSIVAWADYFDTVDVLKFQVRDEEGIPLDQQRLISAGAQLHDGQTLSDHNIQEESIIYLILRLRGGGWDLIPTISFGTGGTIKQVIRKDHNNPRIWDVEGAKVFNVQVLNAARFEDITKMMAPPTPVDIKVYAAAGLPFFDIFNEVPTDVHGSDRFKKIKTVSEMDQMLDVGSSTTYEPGTYIPLQKCQCQNNMLGSIIRPCNHAVCSECAAYDSCTHCPVCKNPVMRIVGIAAPMGAPGTELLPNLPVVLLDRHQVNGGRDKFVSIVRDGAK